MEEPLNSRACILIETNIGLAEDVCKAIVKGSRTTEYAQSMKIASLVAFDPTHIEPLNDIAYDAAVEVAADKYTTVAYFLSEVVRTTPGVLSTRTFVYLPPGACGQGSDDNTEPGDFSST